MSSSYHKSILVWGKKNLFGSVISSVLTLLIALFLISFLPSLIDWLFIKASYLGESSRDCNKDGGACWIFFPYRLRQFVVGTYPVEYMYRVYIAVVMFMVAIVPLAWSRCPYRGYALLYSLLYPVFLYFLLVGGVLGLEKLDDVANIGGFLLTLLLGFMGIALSLPIGIALALGRRSSLKGLHIVCLCFIEFIRAVPLITLLFTAFTLLNYFLPPDFSIELLIRVMIMMTLFSSAYMAEVIRGGLQAIPKGQWEAAQALGLSYFQIIVKIIMPQVLHITIPGICNTFIGLFKDTTLVVIIGMFDPLGVVQASVSDIKWLGLSSEMYIFVAFIFFICCFTLSRYSLHLEKKLDKEQKH